MKCKYCHCPSGFLRRKHKECEEKHNLAIAKIPSVVSKSILEDKTNLYLGGRADKFA